MSENEIEVGPNTSEDTASEERQPSAPEAEEKPEKVKAHTGEEAASAEAKELKPVEAAAVEEKAPAKAEEPELAKAEINKPKAPAKVKVEIKSPVIKDIMATIKNMTVLELSELVKALEAEFGVSAATPLVAAAAAPTGAVAPTDEEQTEFSVILKEIGANKISVIKAVRELTTLGLKESKDFVESAPKAVKDGISRDEANGIKEKLEAAGATAEIK